MLTLNRSAKVLFILSGKAEHKHGQVKNKPTMRITKPKQKGSNERMVNE